MNNELRTPIVSSENASSENLAPDMASIPEVTSTPAIDVGGIGGKTMEVVALGDSPEDIVKNGVAALREDPADAYLAIQSVREKFRGAA